jgi:predicted NUDIX family phosphoesterase
MEFVYVLKRAELFDVRYPQGFLAASEARVEFESYLERARRHGFFVERRHAEVDPSLKQIIPYVVMARGHDVLLLKRTKQGGDSRLHDKYSIGVGGHVNPEDAADGGDPIAAATRREIEEEIVLETSLDLEPIGWINDDATPVGAVHVGLVVLGRLGDGRVAVRETDKLEARFSPLDELERLAADPRVDFETWSRMIVPALRARLGGGPGAPK